MYPINPDPGSNQAGFFFLGNHLALDFLNTKPRLNGEFRELLPNFPSLLRWFQAADLLNANEVARLFSDSTEARDTHQHIVKLREKLRKAVELWECGNPVPRETVTELNQLMAKYPMLFRNKATSGMELWFPTTRPTDLLAPLAYYASKLFAEEDHHRVRQCEACVLHFLDTSKKGTRRWCSMEICGNRAKVAAYAARQRRTS